MSNNALADFIAQSKAHAGPKPGQTYPNMGKKPFAEPKDAQRTGKGPIHPPLPKEMTEGPPPLPAPVPGRFSPKQGMRQIDGSQSTLGDKPQKQAPLQARGPTSSGAHESSFERAMGAAADKHHPPRASKRK